MKRIGHRSIGNFPAATLYLDDLRDIIALFEQHAGGVTVRAGEYEITGAAELGSLVAKLASDPLPDILIKGVDPYVTLDLRSFGASAYVSDDSPSQLGIVARAREIISRGKRPSLRSNVWSVPAWIVSGLGGWLVAAHQPIWGLTAFLIAIVWLSLTTLLGRRELTVHATDRGSRLGFFKRNRDQLILALVSGLLGGAITYAITMATR